MTFRLQLLLLSLLTLLLPWAGCRYAREVETILRDGEQQALLATAATLASVIAADPNAVAGLTSTPIDFQPSAGDFYVHRLRSRPLLDGYADDWSVPESSFGTIAATAAALQVRYAAATDRQYLYLLFIVADRDVAFEQATEVRQPPEKRGDHFWLSLPTDSGTQRLYFFMTNAPGLISARRLISSPVGEPGEIAEPRIQAAWQADREGYRLEVAIPLALIGPRVGFEAVDVGDFTKQPVRAGTLAMQTRLPISGWLMRPAETLEQRLETLLPQGIRAAVAGVDGWIIAESRAHGIEPIGAYEGTSQWLQAIYRRLLEKDDEVLPLRHPTSGRLTDQHTRAALDGRYGTAWFRLPDERRAILSVAAPISSEGVLVLEQTGDRLLVLRDQALTRLLNLTFLVTAAAMLAILIIAGALGWRVNRLKRAAETALMQDGRLNAAIPGTGARDELGELARSFQTLLRRLNEYTEYLRSLAGKLSHELRTPLAIVHSSVENLESEEKGRVSAAYVERARQGIQRLQAILTAMSAATRTEEAVRDAERRNLDLAQLVLSLTQAYADTFPERKFAAKVLQAPCNFYGAPDLLVQLLDKLIENAVDFSPPGSLIDIELQRLNNGALQLSVSNDGAPIAPHRRERLFESMFQLGAGNGREGRGGRAHLGLGLYIVRLIAEFHGGRVFAENVAGIQPSRVRFGVHLPK